MSSHKPSLWRVLSETSHIISANSRHFLALSLLFLFPISLATTIYTLLFQTASLHPPYHQFLPSVSNFSTPDPEIPHAGNSLLPVQILYILFVIIFNLCAVSSITYSTFHGFYSRPVEFVSSLKSILVSFFPLLATKLVTMTIIGLIMFGLSLFMLLPYTGLVLLGFNMDFNSIYFMFFVILIAVLIVGLVLYLEIEWCFTQAIVVVESLWGFAPLKRSSHLVKGMKWVVFLMILFFGVLSGPLSIWYWNLKANFAGNIKEGCSGWVVVQMVVYAGLSAVFSLYGLVAETVLFLYCTELQIEEKIDGKLGGGYVRVPFYAV